MTHEITVELDDARELMFDELAESLGEAPIKQELETACREHLTKLYDNRDQLKPAND